MPRGSWCIILAAFGSLAAVQPPPRQNSQPAGSQAEQGASNTLREIARTLKEANEPDVTVQPCHEGEDNRDSDLCAQWKAADAARDAADATWLFGIIGSLIGAATLIAASAAAKFAKDAAEHTAAGAAESERTNQIAREAQRPWLDFEIVQISMFTSQDTFATSIDLVLNNLGDTPALNATCRARVSTSNGRDTKYGEFHPGPQAKPWTHNVLPKGRAYTTVRPRLEPGNIYMYTVAVEGGPESDPAFHPTLEVIVDYQWGAEPNKATTAKRFSISSVPEGRDPLVERVSNPIALGQSPLPSLVAIEIDVAEVS